MKEDGLEIGFSPEALNRVYLALLALPIFLYILFYAVAGRVNELLILVQSPDSLITIAILLAVALIHEYLHYAVLLLRRVSPSAVRIKFDRSNLSPYMQVDQPISIRTWRLCLMAPALVLTPLLAVGLGFPEYRIHTGLILAISFSGCAYDLAALLGLIGLPAKTHVMPQFRNESGRLYVR